MPRVVLADELSEVVPRFLDPASVASLGCVDRAWARTVAADSCQEAAFKLFLRTEGWELQEVDWISPSREPPINWQERKASYFSDSLAFQCGESSVTLAENFTDQPVEVITSSSVGLIYAGRDDIVRVRGHQRDEALFAFCHSDVSGGFCHQTALGCTVWCAEVCGPTVLATGGVDSTVRLWDLSQGGKSLGGGMEHGDSIFSLQDLGSGRLASGSWDGAVAISGIEMEERKPLATVNVADDAVW